MKVFIFFLTLFVLNVTIVYSQTGTFTFTDASGYGTSSVTQTVDSRTLTVTTTSGLLFLEDGYSYYLELAINDPPQCYDGGFSTSMTLTFSGAVNITTIYCMAWDQGNYNWDFTPTGGSNSPVTNQAINGYEGTTVTLNFVGVTAITITKTGGGDVAFGIDDIVMDAALPVELTSFNAYPTINTVQLKWATATEVNNYGFEIERQKTVASSQNSVEKNFEWEKIGFVNGHGNSNSPKEYSFADDSPLPGFSSYRLKQIDFDGAYEYSDVVTINNSQNYEFVLEQNYPNPFNPATTISFTIPERHDALTTLKVYDILGNEVATLIKERRNSGNYKINFNADKLTSGMYFYTLTNGSFRQTKKMLLVK